MDESIDRMSDFEAQQYIERATRRLKEAAYARGYKDGFNDAKNAEYFKKLLIEKSEDKE